jgi:hypothetical protein
MNVVETVLHDLIDVAAGRKNLPAHAADALHESVTPGFTVVPPSQDALAAARKVLADAELASQAAAAQASGV